MSVKIINGDLFDKNDNIYKICFIVHQVNCQGVMGSGLAKKIKEVYPRVYKEYKEALNNGTVSLGSAQIVFVVDTKKKIMHVVNLFAQDKYGRDKQYTDYEALKTSLINLKDNIRDLAYLPDRVIIRIPYMMGCGLGGGDWNIVLSIINEVFEKSLYEVNIMNNQIL